MGIKREEKKKKGEFMFEESGKKVAELAYCKSAPGEITIYHTEVAEKLRGKDIGKKLVEAAVKYARDNDLKIVAQCPFAAKVIARTPKFQDVLA